MTSAKFTQCVVPGEAGTLAPASLTEATAEMMMSKDAVICSWCTAKLITVDTAGSPGPTGLILLCYTPHAKRQYGILYKNTLARPDLAWAAQMTGHAVFNQVQVCCDEWNVKADEIGLFGDEHLSTDDAPTLFSIRFADKTNMIVVGVCRSKWLVMERAVRSCDSAGSDPSPN